MVVNAVASTSPASFGVVFAAGALTSAGPCVAPRYIAAAAISANARHPFLALGAYVLGLISAYAVIGSVAGSIAILFRASHLIDSFLSIALICGGFIALVFAVPARRCREHNHGFRAQDSIGGPFLVGAASALVISPCCTPAIAVIIAISDSIGRPYYGMILLIAFSLGHAAPLFIAGLANTRAQRWLVQLTTLQSPAIVSGSLMIALGCYYGVVA